MKPPLGTNMKSHSADVSCDILHKQDRIARFAPEKQFSTTFHHRGLKFKRLDAAYLHQIFRQLIYIILIMSAMASLVLLLVGILWNRRSCMTAGCILGLACFGAMLHGCLRHRSLSSAPTPLVLSAAYMCPVGNLPIGSNPEASAAATAVATATLLPKSIHPNSSLLASSLETAILAQLRRDVSIAFPASVPWASTHSITRQSLFPISNEHDIPTAQSYKRQLSDSAAFFHSSGASGAESGSSVPGLQPQLSCPARTGIYDVKSHVYENWSPDLGKHSGLQEKKQTKNNVSPNLTTKADTSSSQSRPGRRSPSEHRGNHAENTQTTTPYMSAFSRQSAFYTPGNIYTHSEDTTYTGSASSTMAVHPITNGPSQVRIVTPEKIQSIPTPQCIVQEANQKCGVGTIITTGLLGLLSDSATCSRGDVRQPRRHTREREGVFGPKIWRAWRSWMD